MSNAERCWYTYPLLVSDFSGGWRCPNLLKNRALFLITTVRPTGRLIQVAALRKVLYKVLLVLKSVMALLAY